MHCIHAMPVRSGGGGKGNSFKITQEKGNPIKLYTRLFFHIKKGQCLVLRGVRVVCG